MQISASMGASAAMQASASLQEASESMGGPDGDGDRDDQITARPVNSTPATNAMGEMVGQLIDVSA